VLFNKILFLFTITIFNNTLIIKSMKRLTLTFVLASLFAFAFTSCDDSSDQAYPDLSKIEAQAGGGNDDTDAGKGN
jgi:hypothetical protein